MDHQLSSELNKDQKEELRMKIAVNSVTSVNGPFKALKKELDSDMEQLDRRLAAVELGSNAKDLLVDRTIIGDALVKVLIDSEIVKRQVKDCGIN